MSENSWYCPKCKTNNALHVNRCSFCSSTKPVVPINKEGVNMDAAAVKLRNDLHQAIEKMDYSRMNRTFRWLEDNIL